MATGGRGVSPEPANPPCKAHSFYFSCSSDPGVVRDRVDPACSLCTILVSRDKRQPRLDRGK